jgi:hypothetical protein
MQEQAIMARYFEDITDGEPLNCQQIAIPREELIKFAKRFDPQLFHTEGTDDLEL